MLKTNRIFQPVTVALVILILVGVSFYHLNFQDNITGFYKVGDVFPLSPFLKQESVLLQQNQVGYDGQFFLTLGLDPFLTEEGTLKALDYPKYRVGRYLLPLSAYLLSLGNRTLIPYTIVFLNGLLILAGVWIFSRQFQREGQTPWLSLLLLCIPGLWIIFGFTTSEIMGGILVLAGLSAMRREHYLRSAIFLSLATLAKEVTVIVWGSCLCSCLFNKNYRYCCFLAISILPFIFFRIFLIQYFGNSTSELLNFSWPLSGHVAVIKSWLTDKHINKNEYFFFPFLCISALYLLSQLKSNWKKQKEIFFASLGYLGLFFMSTTVILDYHISYNRVYFMIYLLVLLSLNKPLSKFDKIYWSFIGLAALRFVYWYAR